MDMKTFQFKIPPKTASLLKKVGQLADERGETAYAVGGFVRDLFLRRPGVDIDITVEGDGLTFAEKLAKLTHSEVEAFTQFGTSIVVIPGFGKVDVATARTESYERPGALPKVTKSGIVQDLYRRDFTINSMALNLSPGYFLKLLDPFGGLEDLKKGRVRALHEKSFLDDPTRIFRAVRFEQRFKTRIEEKTRKWLREAVKGDYIQKVSGERLRNELRLIFQEPHPERAVLRLDELGVLPHIHSALGVTSEAKKSLPHIANAIDFFHRQKIALEEEEMVWFQALLYGPTEKEAEALSKRMMLSRLEQKIVVQSAKSYPDLYKELDQKDATVSRMYKLLCPLNAEVQCFLMAGSPSPGLRKKLAGYFSKVQKAKPWIRGRDLQAIGIPPGFRYSFILLEALNAQLDDKFKNRDEALDWVKKTFVS
jgi:tRNA nucleotidyltransferase (CCA-adding enzyme)